MKSQKLSTHSVSLCSTPPSPFFSFLPALLGTSLNDVPEKSVDLRTAVACFLKYIDACRITLARPL